MGLDDGLGDAHQGGAPHLAGAEQLFHLLQSAGHQHGGQLGQQVLGEHALQLPHQVKAGALHGLQEDVAGVAVAHDDIHRALHGLPCLHIAHKVDAARLSRLHQHGIDGGLQTGALRGLHPDVQQTHPWLRAAQDVLGVVGAHIGKLQQILRGTLGVGPAVDKHCAAVACGHHGGQGGPADAPDALDHQGGPGQQGTGGPGGDKGVPLPAFQQVQAHGEGGVLLLPEGGGRVVAHLHHLAGVGDLHPGGQLLDAVVLQDLQDGLPPAHQNNANAIFPVGLYGTHHRGLGGVVSAHGIYNDLHIHPVLSLSPGPARPASPGHAWISRRSYSASPSPDSPAGGSGRNSRSWAGSSPRWGR